MSKTITSPLGFGLMRLPTTQQGTIDYDKAQEMVDYALANGVNYFDTAYNYHGGESERFIGHALKKYPRESYFLTTKMPVFKLENKEEVEKVFNEQLEKCQTEYFDYYLLHTLNRDHWKKALDFGVLEFLQKQKELGKIKNLGFSFHDSYDALEPIISYTKWDFVQLQLNYYDMQMGDAPQLLAIANQYKVPVIVMEPIRGGFLSRCVPDALQVIKENYGDENRSSALALSYAMSLDGVFLSLSGMSNLDHVIDNINTAKDPIVMDLKAMQTIDKVMEKINSFISIPCTACEYCMPCPVGLNIPEIFKIYNDYQLFRNVFQAKSRIAKLEKKPSDCVSCGKCLPPCPQRLEIPSLMKEASSLESL